VGLDASACGPWENTFLVVFELGHCPNSAWDTKSYPAAHGLDWQRPKLSEMLTEGPLRVRLGIARDEHNGSALPRAADSRRDVGGGLRRANNGLMHHTKSGGSGQHPCKIRHPSFPRGSLTHFRFDCFQRLCTANAHVVRMLLETFNQFTAPWSVPGHILSASALQ
jgi:hypothetical protein